ncbi:MAG: choice-of-anchor R domain-containing protein [Promethearchaeota archaeon]
MNYIFEGKTFLRSGKNNGRSGLLNGTFQKAQIWKKKRLIECFLIISIFTLSILFQMSSIYINTDPQLTNDLKDTELVEEREKGGKEGSVANNNLILGDEGYDRRNLEGNNPKIIYQDYNPGDLSPRGKSNRSPPRIDGTSQSGFDIQEYVIANDSQINVSSSNSWGAQSTQQNLTNIAVFDIQTPSNNSGNAFQFIPSGSYLNITNVIASKSYFPIENKTSLSTRSDTWESVAQNFTLPAKMNLTSVWLNVWRQNTAQHPNMNVTICSDNSGVPGNVLAFEYVIDVTSASGEWYQVNFSSPITLSADTTYWVVMKESLSPNYIIWGYNNVPGLVNYAGMLYDEGTGWEGPNNWSLPLIVQVLRVDGSDQPLTYSSPASCEMTYGGGTLSSFTNIPMNTTAGVDDQVFKTNVSVVFNVTWCANFQSQDTHQVISLNYSVADDSPLVDWNITFACSGVNSLYTLSDYNLTWTTVPTDWEAGDLYQGTTNVTADLNPTINGQTWSILNSTLTTTNYSVLIYRFETTSPNYVTNVGVFPLTYNLTQSVTTSTDFHSNIKINTGQLNVSILFPNNTIKVVNASMSHDASPQDTIIPLLSAYPNGTYQFISLYWNGTEVGLNITSVVTVYTPTELIILRLESDPIPLGTTFTLTAFYNDTVKNLGIPDATIKSYQTDSNWGFSGSLTDEGTGNYSVINLGTAGKDPGSHWIQLSIGRSNYITQTLNISILFQDATGLEIYDPIRDVWFSDVFNLTLRYWGLSVGWIEEAIVTLNSSITMNNEDNNETYWYEINTTEIGKTGVLHYEVNASAGTGYYSQVGTYSITVHINFTNITAIDIAISYNNGTGNYENTILTNYFADQFSFSLEYNDTHRDLALSTTPSITTNLNVNASVSGTGWLFEVAVNGTATQWINITFSEFGYISQTIVFRITVSIAPTLLVGVPIGAIQVLFNTSYDFSIIYRDITPGHGSVAIPNANIMTTGDIFYIGSVAGTYNFRFNTSLFSVGTYFGDITFSRTGYASQQTDPITFNINPRTNTELTGCFASDESKVLTNGMDIYLYYGNDFAFNLTWTDLGLSFNISADTTAALNGQPLPTLGFEEVNVAKSDYDYRFSASLNSLGFWNITIDFKQFGYVNQTWILYIYADLRPTLLSATLTNGTILPNNNIFNFITTANINFNLTWIDVNSSAPVNLQGAVVELIPNIAGAVSRLGLNFTVRADLPYSPPYTVDVTIILNKTGYVPQIFSGSFVITVIGILSSEDLQDLQQYVNETASFTFTMENQFDSTVSDLIISWVLLDTTQSGIASEVGTETGIYEVEIDCSLLAPNDYILQISTEVQNYEPFNKSVILTVLPKSVTLLKWDLPEEFTQGEDLTLEVQLTFDGGSPVVNEIVYFVIFLRYEGKPPDIRHGITSRALELGFLHQNNLLNLNLSDVTDSNGIATVVVNKKYTETAVALESVQVYYSGADRYTGISLSLSKSIPILSSKGDGGVNPIWIIIAAVMAAIFVLSGAIYIRTREKKQDVISRKEAQAYQELIEIAGMRHLLISTLDGVGIYSETFFEQVTSATSPMLAGLITALDTFVQELSKDETEFSQLARSGFNMLSRRGQYTLLTLISETTATEITKKRLREAQNAIEKVFEEVLKLSIVDLSQIPADEIQTICEHTLHTDLLYGLGVDEERMVNQWKKLNRLERKAVQAARRAIQLTEHSVLYLNSWVSEMRELGVVESEILNAIYGVTKRKLVYVRREWRDIVPPT